MRRVRPSEVERLAATAGDSRALRVALVDLLRRQLPVDWWVVVLTDPRTAVGVDPVAVVPQDVRLPTLVLAKYLTPHHRWTSLDRTVTLGDDPQASRVWREVQASHGVRDVLSTVLRDAHGTWGFLDLWSRSRFSAADVALVDAVTATLTAAVRRHQAAALKLTADIGSSAGAGRAAVGPAVLLLEDDLGVVDATAVTQGWLSTLLPPAPGRSPVPAVVWNVAAQLRAVEAGVDRGEPVGRVHVAGGLWLTVQAARLGGGDRIAVSMAPTVGADRLDLVARAFGLTPREIDVVAEVCAGRSNAEVAAAQHLSPLTVQDHLKAAFAKTGVRSRGELAALALGARRSGSE